MIADIFTLALTLFLILNPFGFVPLTIKLLERYPPNKQLWIVAREMIFALVIVLVFVFFGSYILKLLGITSSAISVGGGIILFLIAMSLIFPHHISLSEVDREHEPFIFPLATPMVAGGGVLAAVMVYGAHVQDRWVVIGAVLIAWFVTSIVYLLAPWLARILSEQVLKGIEKLMGLVLILMASQMLISGVVSFVKEDHLPTQNLEKIAPNTSSVTSVPITQPSDTSA